MMMQLGQLADAVNGATVVGDANTAVRGLAYDSRAVRPDFLFVAVPGERFDGQEFLDTALGATANRITSSAPPAR